MRLSAVNGDDHCGGEGCKSSGADHDHSERINTGYHQELPKLWKQSCVSVLGAETIRELTSKPRSNKPSLRHEAHIKS
jgi:hypothetical protein